MSQAFSSWLGSSVRIPNNAKAAVHLWGGNALVKISAACSLVVDVPEVDVWFWHHFAQATQIHFMSARYMSELWGKPFADD